MAMKAQSGLRSIKRATTSPAESRSNENTVTTQPSEQFQDLHARISERAYARYEERGREDGYALDDWLAAERQVLN
jgi:DUF2934 family protein